MIEPSDDESEDSDSDEEFQTVREVKPHTVDFLPTPSQNKPNVSRANFTVNPDDRPITPMKDKMIYSREYSSLDFKDGRHRVCTSKYASRSQFM